MSAAAGQLALDDLPLDGLQALLDGQARLTRRRDELRRREDDRRARLEQYRAEKAAASDERKRRYFERHEARRRRLQRHPHEGFKRVVDPSYAQQLFALSPQVLHATFAVQRVLPLIEKALRKVPETAWHLADLADAPVRLAFVQAAFARALGCAVKFRGGNDCSRGFGAPGSEFPRLVALLGRRDRISDVAVRKQFQRAEDHGIAFRKQRLEPIPFTDQDTGKTWKNRFARNDVYVAASTYEWFERTTAFRPLVDALRAVLRRVTWVWVESKAARQARGRLVSFLEAMTLSREDRHRLVRERKQERARIRKARAQQERDRERKRRQRSRARERADRHQCSRLHSTERSSEVVPISPTSPSETNTTRAGPAAPGESGAPGRGGRRSRPPAGRSVLTGPPSTAEPPANPGASSGRAAFRGGGIANAVPTPTAGDRRGVAGVEDAAQELERSADAGADVALLRRGVASPRAAAVALEDRTTPVARAAAAGSAGGTSGPAPALTGAARELADLVARALRRGGVS